MPIDGFNNVVRSIMYGTLEDLRWLMKMNVSPVMRYLGLNFCARPSRRNR
jgi:hypothetical protein